jgi:hypothetical protein
MMMNAPVRFPFKAALCVSALLALSGCGDGGGGEAAPTNPPVTPPVIEAAGRYAGDLQGNQALRLQTLILDDGSLWAVYGTEVSAGVIAIQGVIQGNATVSGQSIAGTSLRTFIPGRWGPLGLTGSYASSAGTDRVTGEVITDPGTANEGKLAFDVTRLPPAVYNFRTAASTAAIAGNWVLETYDRAQLALQITNVGGVGAFSGQDPSGCQVTGALAPDATKNFFTATLTFGQAPCPDVLKGVRLTGVAFASSVAAGTTQLGMVLVDGSRTIALPLAGTR